MKGHPVNKDPSLYERTMSGRLRRIRKIPAISARKPARMRQGNPEHEPDALGFVDLWKRVASFYSQLYDRNRRMVKICTLSRVTGTNRHYLSNYLLYQTKLPKIQKADEIMKALGISLNDLMFGSEVIPPSLLPKRKKEEKLQKHLRNIDKACAELTKSEDPRVRIAAGRIAESLDDACHLYKLTLIDVLDPKGMESYGSEPKISEEKTCNPQGTELH